MHTSTLRVGFVPGVEPDRFLQRWKAARRSAYLELVPVPLSAQQTALAEGEVDMCFVRLPLEAEDLHLVPLWEERAAVVVGHENVLSLLEEISADDLEGETEIQAEHPDDARDRVAIVATGVGYTRMPLSLARLHHRKDAVHRPSDRTCTWSRGGRSAPPSWWATRTCSACSRRSAPMTSRARPRSRRNIPMTPGTGWRSSPPASATPGCPCHWPVCTTARMPCTGPRPTPHPPASPWPGRAPTTTSCVRSSSAPCVAAPPAPAAEPRPDHPTSPPEGDIP